MQALAPVRQFGGLSERLDSVLPEPLKGRARLILGVLAVTLVAGIGVSINWGLYSTRLELQRDVESQERAVARIPGIRQDLKEEHAATAALVREQGVIYAMVPDLTNVPVIAHQLELLGQLAGGRTDQVEYAPMQQQEERVDIQFKVRFSGDFGAALTYLHNLTASFPTVTVRQLSLERPAESNGGPLVLSLDLVLGALKARDPETPPWDFDRLVANPVRALGRPFTAPPMASAEAESALLPNWALKGILRAGAARMALFSVNGTTRWMRTGERFAGVELLEVAEGSAVVESGGRRYTLKLDGSGGP